MSGKPSLTWDQAVLDAMAGVTAYEADMFGEVLAVSSPAAFAGAVALVAKLKEEVRKLGGDPDELLRRVYARAAVPS